VLSVAAWTSGIGIRYGPRGIETWPVWEMMLRVTDWIGWFLPAPRGTQIERVRLPSCRAEWVRARGVAPGGRVLLYFHGGGYVGAGLSTHRRLVARISAAADASVLNVAYRMLPRWAVVYAIEDGVAAYRKLLEDGVPPERIVLGGDSAGGGLVFLVALAARKLDLPQPAGIVAISPWADFDMKDKLEHPNAATDPFLPASGMRFVVDQLICKGEPLDPELSPVNADLTGLPPTLIHVGTTEVLENDAVKLSEQLAATGVPVRRKHWRGQVHDFQIAADLLPEGRQAIREIGAFIAQTATDPR
jgi:acetyl esterase/lipase